MKSIAAGCALFMLATPAAALSCNSISPMEMFDHFADAPQNYVLALGSFQRDIPLSQAQIAAGRAEFRFEGITLSANTAQDHEVSVQVTAHWPTRLADGPRIAGDDRVPPAYSVGHDTPRRQLLVFLDLDGSDLHYTDQLCLPNPILNPAPSLVQQYRMCLMQGRCGDHDDQP